MTFSHSAHQWCNKKPGETVTQFLKKKKVGFDPKPTSMHLKNDGSRQSLPLPFSSQWFTNKNYKKKFSKEGRRGRAKTRKKKGENVAWFNLLVSFVYLFPFLLQASFRPLLPSIDFPDSGSLQNQQTWRYYPRIFHQFFSIVKLK